MADRTSLNRSTASSATSAPTEPELPDAAGKSGLVPAESGPDRDSNSLVWPLLTALALALVVVTLPRLPLGTDDDSSWAAVLGFAHQKGLQFGTEITFTYGPLGFLMTPYQCPAAPGLRLLADLGIALVSTAGLCLLAWHLRSFWRWFVVLAFLFLAGNAEPRTETLLTLGLLSWAMLCLVEEGRHLTAAVVVLVGLSVFAALGKVTFLLITPLGLLAVAWDLGLRGRPWMGIGLLAGFGAGVALTWLLLGQALSHLGRFLATALTFTSGYSRAMHVKYFFTPTWIALLMLAFALAAVLLRLSRWRGPNERHIRWRRAAVVAWLTAWLFLTWKHGFVRTGRDHVVVFFAFAPILTLLLEAFPGAGRIARWSARGLAMSCCVLAILAWHWLLAGNLKSWLIHPFKLAGAHAQALVHPFAAADRLRELQQTESETMQLPRLREKIGPNSADVFGFNQSYAVFNGLNYRPRPVFQSYAAYSEPLMKLNEEFYRSETPPQYVLFRLSPIDDRFPPLEDALLFRHLLLNYTPIDAEGPFLLLESRHSNPAGIKLLFEGQVHPGKPIDLTGYPDTDLWLELNLKPTLAGRARSLLYQAPEVELGVWCRGTTGLRTAKFRAPAPMLAAGFIASPLLLDDQDVLDLYTAKSITRPLAYSVELARGSMSCWQDAIRFRLFKIQARLGRSAPPELGRLLQYPGFEVAPAAVVSPTNAILQIRGKPALYLPPGSYMRFAVPESARRVKGSFGFAPAAYSFGGVTEGAEFRIEEELPDGRMQLLHSRVLRPRTNPDDRGLQPFALDCPGEGQRDLLFRIRPLATAPSAWDLTCWADIGFN